MSQVYHLMLQEPLKAKIGWRCNAVDQQGTVRLRGWGLSAAAARRSAHYALKRYYYG